MVRTDPPTRRPCAVPWLLALGAAALACWWLARPSRAMTAAEAATYSDEAERMQDA